MSGIFVPKCYDRFYTWLLRTRALEVFISAHLCAMCWDSMGGTGQVAQVPVPTRLCLLTTASLAPGSLDGWWLSHTPHSGREKGGWLGPACLAGLPAPRVGTPQGRGQVQGRAVSPWGHDAQPA